MCKKSGGYIPHTPLFHECLLGMFWVCFGFMCKKVGDTSPIPPVSRKSIGYVLGLCVKKLRHIIVQENGRGVM